MQTQIEKFWEIYLQSMEANSSGDIPLEDSLLDMLDDLWKIMSADEHRKIEDMITKRVNERKQP